jgi:S-adenosylmethionine decarboxylase
VLGGVYEKMNELQSGMENEEQYFGPHLMLDLWECDPATLQSTDFVFDFLNSLPDKVGMTKMILPYVCKWKDIGAEVPGVSGFVMIAESHISIHTFPEKGFVFVDLFSCKPFDIEQAKEHIVKAFGSARPVSHLVKRPSPLPGGNMPNDSRISDGATIVGPIRS